MASKLEASGRGFASVLPHVLALLAILAPARALAFEVLRLDGVPVEARLESGQEWIPPGDPRSDPRFNRQVYAFDVEAGETVDVWVTADFDAFLTVYREDGARVATADDFRSQFDARIAVNLEVGGRYFLIVTSLVPERTGSFTLTARALGVGAPLPPDYEAQEPAALGWPDVELWPADPVLGEERRGALEADERAPVPEAAATALPEGARDVHVLAGQAATMVTLDLRARFDGVLYLVSPGGAVLAWNDDYANLTHSRLADVVLPETGDYAVVVTTSELGGGAGDYVLTIGETRAAPPFSPDGAVVLDEAVRGELTSDDRARVYGIADRVGLDFFRDAYAFEAVDGQAVEMVVEADFGAYLYLLGPDGGTVEAGGDYPGEGRLTVSAPVLRAGPHRVVLTSASPGGGGSYVLTLRAIDAP